MDYTKFAILTMACIGGFMATSYSSLAHQKGWTVGSMFTTENMSFVIVGGFMCQFGSIIISFFVNPWWSAIIVFALGFIGYLTLSSILKVYSQVASGILIVASFILIPIYVFGSSSISDNLEHFKASIDFSNKAAQISNQGEPFETIDEKTIEKIMIYMKQALKEARQVDIHLLNKRLVGFGDHYKDEFINGLETLIGGYETNDSDKFLQGQILLDKWGTWYSLNVEYIRNSKNNSEKNYSPSNDVTNEYPKLNASELDRYSKILKKSHEVKLTNSDLEILSGIFRDYTKRTGRYMTKNEYDLFLGLVKLSYDYQYELGQSVLFSWDNQKYFTTNGFDELYEKMKLLGSRKPEKLKYDLLTIKAASHNEMIIEDEFGEKYEFGREIILKGIRKNELAYENYNKILKVIEKFVK